MFNKIYGAAMRNGSRVLFVIAILLFVVGARQGLRTLSAASLQPLSYNNEFQWGWLDFVAAVLAAVSYSVPAFIGALVIDRADRWLAQRRQSAAGSDVAV